MHLFIDDSMLLYADEARSFGRFLNNIIYKFHCILTKNTTAEDAYHLKHVYVDDILTEICHLAIIYSLSFSKNYNNKESFIYCLKHNCDISNDLYKLILYSMDYVEWNGYVSSIRDKKYLRKVIEETIESIDTDELTNYIINFETESYIDHNVFRINYYYDYKISESSEDEYSDILINKIYDVLLYLNRNGKYNNLYGQYLNKDIRESLQNLISELVNSEYYTYELEDSSFNDDKEIQSSSIFNLFNINIEYKPKSYNELTIDNCISVLIDKDSMELYENIAAISIHHHHDSEFLVLLRFRTSGDEPKIIEYSGVYDINYMYKSISVVVQEFEELFKKYYYDSVCESCQTYQDNNLHHFLVDEINDRYNSNVSDYNNHQDDDNDEEISRIKPSDLFDMYFNEGINEKGLSTDEALKYALDKCKSEKERNNDE